jgi:hypothetical protein
LAAFWRILCDGSETGFTKRVWFCGSRFPSEAPVTKELVCELRQLLIDPWPTIRDSVAVNESKFFAQRLEDLGQRWQCQPLVNYVQKLLFDAENYAVTDLEKHLGEFALLVEQLDRSAHI